MKILDKQLGKNILYQGLYQSLVIFYPILTTPIISRAFGSEVLGIYSFTYSIAYYFSVIAGLGIHTHGSRIIASSREDSKLLGRQFKSIYSIQILASFCVFVFYIIYILCFSNVYKETQLLQGIVIIAAMVDISWFLSGLEQIKAMVIRNTTIKLSSLAFIYLLIHSKRDLNKYILIVAGTNLLGQLLMWPIAGKYFHNVVIKFGDIKEHILPVCKLFLPVLALNSYALVDKVILGIFRTINEVGYYENCDKLIRMPVGLSSALCAVIFPRMAYYVSKGEYTKNNQLIINILRYNYIIVIPLIIGLQGMAPGIVSWYMGEDFYPCAALIKILAPIIFFMITNYIVRLLYFVSSKKDKEYLISILLSVFLNVVLNLLLVGSYGVYGVIIASLCSEMAATFFLWKKSQSELHYETLSGDLGRSIILSFIMLIIVQAVGKYMELGFWASLIQGGVGIIIYGGLYLAIKWIQRK